MAYLPIKTDVLGDGQVVYGGAQADAFGRGRVSEPQTLFNVSFQYDAQPLLMQVVNVGSGTAVKTTNVSSMTLSTGGTTTAWGTILQSKGYYRYEPGKSQFILMTGVLGAYAQNVRQQIGYYDVNDGAFFDMNGNQGASGKCAVTLRTSTSGSASDTNSVLSTSWNIDKMDGTGVSGITIDFTKTQIFVIDLEWLGTGRVRFGFVVNGILYYCHQFVWANSAAATGPYMNTACLPLRWEIHNIGAAGGSTSMYAVCGAIISEGGNQAPKALQHSTDNGITGKSCTTTLQPLLSISPVLTFNSIVNRAKYNAIDLNVLNTNNNAGRWVLLFNPSLAGTPAFAQVVPSSAMSVDVAATAIGGITISATSTSGGSTTYTWAGNSINGASQGLNNQWVGYQVVVSGYNGANTGNNGTFTITASTGTTFTVANATGTSATTGAPIFTVGGIPLTSGYFQANNTGGGLISPQDLASLKYSLNLDVAGQIGDVLSLCAQAQTGTDTIYGSIVWTEER